MTDTQRPNRLLLGVGVTLFVASSVAVLWQGIGLEASQIIANAGFVAVGTLIMLRRPDNVLGPIVLGTGVIWNLLLIAEVTAQQWMAAGDIESAGWLALLAGVATPFAIGLFYQIILFFPTGRIELRFGRALFRFGIGVVAGSMVLAVFARPTTFGIESDFVHPFVPVDVADTFAGLVTPVLAVLIFTSLVAAVLMLLRMRQSDAVVRRQIGWFFYAFVLYIVISSINIFVSPLGPGGGFLLLDAIGFVLIPIAIGFAIMKYRLFDIDVIVNRSITYGLLALFIGVIYVGVVVGLGSVLSDSTTGLSIAAIVIVAIAFQPVRRRVQRWANRVVYGERATPYEVLAQFSRRSAELSHEELMERIPKLIVDGTGAETAAVWIRSGHGFGVASSWPTENEARLVADTETFEDPEADYSLPVFHDGELLGGLSLAKVRGESISPSDEELLADLAGAMGLALRNAALTAELRQQVAELEASRERVLAAADQARRDLERDLDSGPQQRLVALKVKLGPIRKLAERAGAEKTASVLGQLETEAGAAIQAVRDFAGGVYPPLLEAEGLAVAITQQARKAAFPVSVHGEGLGRYGREIEAAVYFAVLEALQNTAKYANATSASVSLADTGKELLFEVRDDGDGFDPAVVERGAGLDGMADRLDTVGGRVSIDSTSGEGTTVSGAVPVQALVGA